MTEQELADLKALCAAAAPGPWQVEETTGPDLLAVSTENFRYVALVGLEDRFPDDAANAAFIAANRVAVPRLIAEVRRLRELFSLHLPSVDPDANISVHVCGRVVMMTTAEWRTHAGRPCPLPLTASDTEVQEWVRGRGR
jgi:hypothetical protein